MYRLISFGKEKRRKKPSPYFLLHGKFKLLIPRYSDYVVLYGHKKHCKLDFTS